MSRFAPFGLIAATFLMFAGTANATPVMIRDNPDNGSSVFADSLGRAVSITHDGIDRRVGAGVFGLQFGSDADSWTDFLTFCLQLDEILTLPKEHNRVSGGDYFLSDEDREAIGIIYGNLLTDTLGLRDATSAAALQILIWEIIEDGATSFDLTSGSFLVRSASVLAEATTLWALVISGQFEAIGFDVFVAESTQDLLVTPIPGALPLLLSGLIGLGFASRKNKSVH